jgi:hypothetical protein
MCAVLLAGTVFAELRGNQSQDNAEPGSRLLRHAAATEPRAAPSRQAMPVTTAADARSILARPLFSADRRPSREPGAAKSSKIGSLPRLAGIVVDGGVRLAIFQPGDGGKPMEVGIESLIGEDKIDRIAAEEVVVSGPDGERRLRPKPDPGMVIMPPAPLYPPHRAAGPGRRTAVATRPVRFERHNGHHH